MSDKRSSSGSAFGRSSNSASHQMPDNHGVVPQNVAQMASGGSRFNFQMIEGDLGLDTLPFELIQALEWNCDRYRKALPSCIRPIRSSYKPMWGTQDMPTPYVLAGTFEELLAFRYESKDFRGQITVVQQKPDSSYTPQLNDGKPVIVMLSDDRKAQQSGQRFRWYIWGREQENATFGPNSDFVEKLKAGTKDSKEFRDRMMLTSTSGDDESSDDTESDDSDDDEDYGHHPPDNNAAPTTTIKPQQPDIRPFEHPIRADRRASNTASDTNSTRSFPAYNPPCRSSEPIITTSSLSVQNGTPTPHLDPNLGRASLTCNTPSTQTSQPPTSAPETANSNRDKSVLQFVFAACSEGQEPERIPINQVCSSQDLFEAAWTCSVIDDNSTTIKVNFHGKVYHLHKVFFPEKFERMVQEIIASGRGGDAVVTKVF